MPRRTREAIRPFTLEAGSAGWPSGLGRLGSETPVRLHAYGDAALLRRPLTGIFCSQRVPGRVVLQALELAQRLADAGIDVISGFQSPVERELLTILLRGRGGVVVCPARSLVGATVKRAWAEPLLSRRLLLVTQLDGDLRRPTAALAMRRNRMAAAMSSRVILLHATPGGQLWRLAAEIVSWAMPIECLEHRANADLRLLGAVPIPNCSGAGASRWDDTGGRMDA